MNAREHVKLVFGPYQAPSLRKGNRTSCLSRDRDVKVIGWSNARIPWPLCRPLGTRGGGWGLRVDDELARAIRQERAATICHWWGVCGETVWRWRKAFGVERMDSPGSQRLILAASEEGAEQFGGVPLPAEQVKLRRRRALEQDMGRNLQPGYHGPCWTSEQMALLGTAPDEETASRIGRTTRAVRVMRTRLGIANSCDRRRRECRG